MKLKPVAIKLLCLLNRQKQPVKVVRLSTHFLGTTTRVEIDGTAEQLVADGFLVYDTSSEQYSVTEAGKQYLVKYDTYGMDEIRKGNLSFAVLRFFSELDGGLETEFLPKSFSENAPKNGNSYPELNLLNFLDFKMNQFIGKNRYNKYEINSADNNSGLKGN